MLSSKEIRHRQKLEALVDRALADFGVECFWNVRTDLELIPQAKVVAARLAKHGGMRGLRQAHEIEQVLRELGEMPWR
jgi:hypothetical protein